MMENKHHQFIANMPITIHKYGGVGVTLQAKVSDGVIISLTISDAHTQNAINDFLIKVKKVQEALDA